MSIEKPTEEQEGKSLYGKAYDRGFETANTIRDLMRGWGDFEDGDKDPLVTELSRVADICVNRVNTLIEKNAATPFFKDDPKNSVSESLREEKERLREVLGFLKNDSRIRNFEPITKLNILVHLAYDAIENNLDYIKVIERVSQMVAYARCIEDMATQTVKDLTVRGL